MWKCENVAVGTRQRSVRPLKECENVAVGT